MPDLSSSFPLIVQLLYFMCSLFTHVFLCFFSIMCAYVSYASVFILCVVFIATEAEPIAPEEWIKGLELEIRNSNLECSAMKCIVKLLGQATLPWTLTLQTTQTRACGSCKALNPLTLLRLWDDLWHHGAQNGERHDRQKQWHPHCGEQTTGDRHYIIHHKAGTIT